MYVQVYHTCMALMWGRHASCAPINICETDLYVRKRALYINRRALYIRRRGLYIHKKAPYIRKRALYIRKRALYIRKRSARISLLLPLQIDVGLLCFEIFVHYMIRHLYIKSPIYAQKSPVYPQKSPIYPKKRRTNLSIAAVANWRWSSMFWDICTLYDKTSVLYIIRNLCISRWSLYYCPCRKNPVCAKEPYICAKEP